jgi:hypothetical protein
VVLPLPRRSPQQHARRTPAVDELPQRRARGEQVLLADNLVERPWPHASGKRRRSVGKISGCL